MQRAVVVYRSRTGTTRRFAEAIAAHLATAGLTTEVASVGDADFSTLRDADYVFLGAWTNGLFVVAQHPDEPWVAFVRAMPPLFATATDGERGRGRGRGPRVALFTTYRLLTGSMFARMRSCLGDKAGPVELELSSRDGRLSEAQRRQLDGFLTASR